MNFTIKEYQQIFCKGDSPTENNGVTLDRENFELLKLFISSRYDQQQKSPNKDLQEIMKIVNPRGKMAFQATNHVGMISLKNGTQIEILPKVYHALNDDISGQKTRGVFMRMLQSLPDIPRIHGSAASLDHQKMPMLEIFFRYFIDELFLLIKRGLKSDYILQTSNEIFLKGKLLFPEHIKRNIIHKERFFVAYDEFSLNRPENRLIKSTIQILRKISTNATNQKDLNILQAMMSDIKESANIDADFAKVTYYRTAIEYKNVIEWCRLFLKKFTLTTFVGHRRAFSFLFPMDRVFECYAAKKLRALLPPGFSLSTQDRGKYLIDKPRRFELRPDIVIKDSQGAAVLILDTKWKIFNEKPEIPDIYQMFVYLKRYETQKVFLLYPLYDKDTQKDYFWNNSDETIGVRFFDLENMEKNREMLNKLLLPPLKK